MEGEGDQWSTPVGTHREGAEVGGPCLSPLSGVQGCSFRTQPGASSASPRGAQATPRTAPSASHQPPCISLGLAQRQKGTPGRAEAMKGKGLSAWPLVLPLLCLSRPLCPGRVLILVQCRLSA